MWCSCAVASVETFQIKGFILGKDLWLHILNSLDGLNQNSLAKQMCRQPVRGMQAVLDA